MHVFPEILCMKIGAMEVQRYQCRVSEVIYSDVMKIGAMEVQRYQCMTRINMKLKERYIYIYIYILSTKTSG
jgi:hypothetical protein